MCSFDTVPCGGFDRSSFGAPGAGHGFGHDDGAARKNLSPLFL